MNPRSKHQILVNSVIIVFIFIVLSCNKEISTPVKDDLQIPENDTIMAIHGNIQLPKDASSLSLNNWSVNSGYSNGNITSKEFSLPEAGNDYNILFLSDEADNVRLMGLIYPGQTDLTINGESTVLAMLMKMPSVSSLNASGKKKLLQSIRSNPAFKEAVSIFENGFVQNRPIFDTSNAIFNQKLVEVFETSSLRTTEINNIWNVNFVRAGRTITIQNPGHAFSRQIGVYKDGVKIKSIELDGYEFFSGSIPEIINTVFNPTDPIEETITLTGDGNFTFKVRTGKPYAGIYDEDSRQAFINNLTIQVLYHIESLIKFFNKECLGEVGVLVADQALNYTSLLSSTNGSLSSLTSVVTQVSLTTLEIMKTSNDCLPQPSKVSFIKKVGQFLNFIEPISRMGTKLNIGNHLSQFILAPGAFDTCFRAVGNIISECTVSDSTELYRLAAIGDWTVSNAENPNNPPRDLQLFDNGTGKYIGEGGVPFPNGGYGITWSIKKTASNKYYLYESGFWHPGFNQFRIIGSGLPDEFLTYPPKKMKTYNDLGNGPIETLTYIRK